MIEALRLRIGLQWGRDVSIPEMPGLMRPLLFLIRFNGAGMFPSQKCEGMHPHGGDQLASMGPGCFHPRNPNPSLTEVAALRASMGPGCFHPRN